MNIPVGSWQLWAVLSAAFAALTAIFAKVGIENINSDFATLTVVSRRHFFFVAPDWRHVTGTMMAALGGLRGFVGERR